MYTGYQQMQMLHKTVDTQTGNPTDCNRCGIILKTGIFSGRVTDNIENKK